MISSQKNDEQYSRQGKEEEGGEEFKDIQGLQFHTLGIVRLNPVSILISFIHQILQPSQNLFCLFLVFSELF
jgi:hypothetical protein